MITHTDTGILLRLLDRADPHHPAIRQALRVLRGRGDEPVTSPQDVAEFCYDSLWPAVPLAPRFSGPPRQAFNEQNNQTDSVAVRRADS